MSEGDQQGTSGAGGVPSLDEQIRLFCKAVGVTLEDLEARLGLGAGGLGRHRFAAGGQDPELAAALRRSFPGIDWVPGSDRWPGEGWQPTTAGGDEEGPRTDTEKRMLKIWRKVLGVEAIGVHDDFKALGGDSIKASKILTRIRDVFEIRLPMEIAGQASTISDLAEIVDRALEVERTVILRVHQESGPHRQGS